MFELADTANNSMQYQFSGYLRSDDYKGFRHSLVHQQKIDGWQFNNVFKLTNINSATEQRIFS